MGNFVGLNGSEISPLALTIRAALVSDGSASQDIEGLTVSVDEWRPVRTFASADAIHAVLCNWALTRSFGKFVGGRTYGDFVGSNKRLHARSTQGWTKHCRAHHDFKRS